MLIDDFSDPSLTSTLATQWQPLSDQVMGGISRASVRHVTDSDGIGALHLSGAVRLENNGGFIQAGLDLTPGDQGTVDWSSHGGIGLRVSGSADVYGVHLRTADLSRPWQSFRARFDPTRDGQPVDEVWRNISMPWEQFQPHRTEQRFDPARLRRLSIIALGKAFQADLKLCRLWLWS